MRERLRRAGGRRSRPLGGTRRRAGTGARARAGARSGGAVAGAVAVRPALAPGPRVGDHRLEVLLGHPAELRADLLAGGDELRGVAGAARVLLDGDLAGGGLARRLDDLAHGVAEPVAEVVDRVLAGADRIHREQVRAAEVLDVDVVAH